MENRKKKVHITAYLNQNLGDDLFVYIMCKQYKMVKFYMAGPSSMKHTFNNLPNLTYICNDTLLLKIVSWLQNKIRLRQGKKIIFREKWVENQLAKRFTYNVLVTGSMYIEVACRYRELEMEFPWYQSHPLILSCNFGPYHTKDFYQRCHDYFQMTTHTCFRDRDSVASFQDLSNVSYAPDIAFNINHDTRDDGYYVVSVIDLIKSDFGKWKQYRQQYIDTLVGVVNEWIRLGKKVYLFGCCKYLGDMDTIDEIVNKVHHQNKKLLCSVCYEEIGMEETLNIFAYSRGILATRFHALVLGIAFQKQVYPIAYSSKMEQLLREIGIQDNSYETYEINDFVNRDVEYVMNHFIDTKAMDVQTIKKEAKRHFHLFEQMLEEGVHAS